MFLRQNNSLFLSIFLSNLNKNDSLTLLGLNLLFVVKYLNNVFFYMYRRKQITALFGYKHSVSPKANQQSQKQITALFKYEHSVSPKASSGGFSIDEIYK